MRHPGANLSRRDWLVESVPHGEAVAAIHAWHYSRSAPNTGQAFGLFRRDSYPLTPIAGAALWLPPTKRAGERVAGDEWQGVLSLSRLVVAPDLPRNAATFLLARSMRLVDRNRWPVLLTFADTEQGHTGAIYKATGWEYDGESVTGQYFVTPDGRQVGRKRGRRNYSAAELIASGCKPVKSAKLRFVHRSRAATRSNAASTSLAEDSRSSRSRTSSGSPGFEPSGDVATSTANAAKRIAHRSSMPPIMPSQHPAAIA